MYTSLAKEDGAVIRIQEKISLLCLFTMKKIKQYQRQCKLTKTMLHVWPVFLLPLICTTSNASRLLQIAVPHWVLPKYLLGISSEWNEHSNSQYQLKYPQQHLYCLYTVFPPKRSTDWRPTTTYQQSLQPEHRGVLKRYTVQFKCFPIQWMKWARPVSFY